MSHNTRLCNITYPLRHRQIACADVVLLNKADLTSAEEVKTLETHVHRINRIHENSKDTCTLIAITRNNYYGTRELL